MNFKLLSWHKTDEDIKVCSRTKSVPQMALYWHEANDPNVPKVRLGQILKNDMWVKKYNDSRLGCDRILEKPQGQWSGFEATWSPFSLELFLSQIVTNEKFKKHHWWCIRGCWNWLEDLAHYTRGPTTRGLKSSRGDLDLGKHVVSNWDLWLCFVFRPYFLSLLLKSFQWKPFMGVCVIQRFWTKVSASVLLRGRHTFQM